MKTTARSLGDRVRERRRALGLSQPQLAKKVGGITYQAIQQLEGGGGSRHLVPIARALGVTAEWLQDGVGPAPSKTIALRHPATRTKKAGGHHQRPQSWAWRNAAPMAGRCGTAM